MRPGAKTPMNNLFRPFRFKLFRRTYGDRAIHYLDVGCGSHSPSITKRWFPRWRYHGIDRPGSDYPMDAADRAALEAFYEIDLSTGSLSVVPDGQFDLASLSHVIEHLPNGLEVLREVAAKLRPGGRVYVEFPSERSLGLPSMPGTLNFSDDETHVRVYSVREVANVLLDEGFRVVRAGTRRDWFRIAFLPLLVPARLLAQRRVIGADFWDATGFASFVYAEKRDVDAREDLAPEPPSQRPSSD